VFNGVDLPATALAALRAVGLSLPPGRYWYDAMSGLWGGDGGPTVGQLPAGLALGGALRADASGGGTGTFINGRELHPVEVQRLALLFGSVPRIRFWMNAQGVGGPEGGPATFSLQAAMQPPASGGGAIHRGVFGTVGGSGGEFFFNDPATGSSVVLGD
jgi:hypothetical protein